MLNVPLDRIITVTEARDNFAKVVDGAKGGEIYVLTKGGRPCVAIVDVRFLEEATGQRLNTQVITAGAYNPALEEKSHIEARPPIQKETTSPVEEKKTDMPIKNEVKPVVEEKKEDESNAPDFREFSELDKSAPEPTFSLPSADTIKFGEPNPPTPSTSPTNPPSPTPKTSPFTPPPIPPASQNQPDPKLSTPPNQPPQPKTTTIPIISQPPQPQPPIPPTPITNPSPVPSPSSTSPVSPAPSAVPNPQGQPPISPANPTVNPTTNPTQNPQEELDDLDIG